MNIGKTALPHNFVVRNEGSVLPQCHSYLHIIQFKKKPLPNEKTSCVMKLFIKINMKEGNLKVGRIKNGF